jgi:hypothetical protein
MPVLWTVREGMVFLTLIGDFKFHDIQSATLDAYMDRHTPPGAPILVDGRLSLVPLSLDEAQRRSEWFGELLQRGVAGRCAIVTGVSEYRHRILIEGIGPQKRAGLPIWSFVSFAEAVAWLKAPER